MRSIEAPGDSTLKFDQRAVLDLGGDGEQFRDEFRLSRAIQKRTPFKVSMPTWLGTPSSELPLPNELGPWQFLP